MSVEAGFMGICGVVALYAGDGAAVDFDFRGSCQEKGEIDSEINDGEPHRNAHEYRWDYQHSDRYQEVSDGIIRSIQDIVRYEPEEGRQV